MCSVQIRPSILEHYRQSPQRHVTAAGASQNGMRSMESECPAILSRSVGLRVVRPSSCGRPQTAGPIRCFCRPPRDAVNTRCDRVAVTDELSAHARLDRMN